MSVSENSSWMYEPVITHTNATTSSIDWIGQSLPQFPFDAIANLSDITFYLRPAGTINITAMNSSGSAKPFHYVIKDTLLGYPVSEGFTTMTTEVVVNVPRDRNYSIMIYPNESLPVSYDWNNFSSSSSYDFTYSSSYNATTHQLNKKFNCSKSYVRVTGFIQNLTGNDFRDWNEFTIIPFILEPGNMVYLGDGASMPYNMSAWRDTAQSDIYDLTTGFYNITLPSPAETANYILFATARNGTEYYGGYRNITLSSSDEAGFNFTMLRLMSTEWGTSKSNFTMDNAGNWNSLNISSAKQNISLVNSTSVLTTANAHIEATVDYSDYNCSEFTFMTDVSQSSGAGIFYLPLLNTSVKEINVYSQTYAPKRQGTETATEILTTPNITMSTFNPGKIGSTGATSGVYVSLYKSNSSCDVPNPSFACTIANSTIDNFNPLSSIIGGGKISFRMGLASSGIEVHYVNVDMLASGPPSASFDDSANVSTSSGFESALRFGSDGPTIYDYVLISMPYTNGSTSQTGLNASAEVNMSIPLLYDEDWHVIWNASANGTSGSALAGNQSHYSTYSTQWETLMKNNTCTTNVSEFNSTNPCYKDLNNSRIWIRLPHFSGTKPEITGAVITATTTSPPGGSGSSGSSGGSGGSPIYTPEESELIEGYQKVLYINYGISFNTNNETHTIKVQNITETQATITVSSETQEATLSVGEEKKFDVSGDNYYDLLVKLNSIDSTNALYPSANFTIQKINEEILPPQQEQAGEQTPQQTTNEKTSSSIWIWISVGIVLVLIISVIIYKRVKSNKSS